MSLIGLLIAIIIVCVFLWCVRLIIKAFSIPEPMATVLFVLAILICLISLVQWFWGGPGMHVRIP